ncbi:MAG: RluA family pseudouridine synthase [Zetaproteobacteria bacterium]|nr:RluA family pseudouridine synthase [Zetaproteobacteria bacterium]
MANIINEKGQLIVPSDEDGSRLDRMLVRQLGADKRTLMMRLIRKGNVRVNGKRCKPNHHVCKDDEVFLPMSLRTRTAGNDKPLPMSALQKERILALPILFEDAWLLVINKPAGMVVHGGSGHGMGLIEMLKEVRALPDLRLAHRLDRDTSGVLLLAKNLEALRQLTEAFRERDMDKTYLAWVKGHPEPSAARMTSHLSKGVTVAGERMVVDDDEGKLSVTDYQVMQTIQADRMDYALLALKPHSGRTHQLRVQLQQEGHAILGDVKYATRDALKTYKIMGGKGLMLHAWRLKILHPMTHQTMTFLAAFPERMRPLNGKRGA